MASDDEDQTATVYVDDEEDDDESDEDQQQQNHILQNQNIEEEEEDVDLIDDEADDNDDDDDEEEDDSTSSAAGDVTIAVAGAPNVSETIAAVTTTPTTVTTPATAAVSALRSDEIVEVKKLDDSRRLFQRLWTDEDEIELLQGFLDYTIQRGTNHHDTAAFYDQIKGKLQLEFNKNQLVEKLRRLKKKYRNVLTKISSGKEYVFKSSHDQATFDLSCKIWNEAATAATPVSVAAVGDGGGIDDEEGQNTNVSFNLNDYNGNGIGFGVGDGNSLEKKIPRPRKRARVTPVKLEENYNHQQQQYGQAMGAGGSNSNPNHVTANLVEETVKSCLLPLFKELVNNSPNGGVGNSRGFGFGLGLGGMNVNSFGGSMNFPTGDMKDEKWRKQQILELEVYSKRLDLMQDQIKSWLEELRSMGN